MAERGRDAVAIFMALVIVAAAAVGAWKWLGLGKSKSTEGFLVGLHAVDANRAVFCMRANYKEDPSRSWIALIDREQGLLWHDELPAVPIAAPYDGISVAGGVVTVRTGAASAEASPLTTVAYSLESGAQLWQQVLSEGEPTPSTSAGPMANEELHIAAYESPGAITMVAFARQSGDLLWRRVDNDHGPILRAARLIGSHLLSEPPTDALFYSLADDSPALELDSRGPGCLVGGLYYALGALEDEPGALFLTSVEPARNELRNPVFRRVDLPRIEGASDFVKVEACATYQGSLVFSIMRARAGSVDGLEIAAIAPDTGALAWHLDLGAVTLSASLDQFLIHSIYRQSYPLSGDLPRFVPVLLDQTKEGHHPRLTILDFEERRVVRQGPERYELIHAAVFRVGTTSYVVGRLAGPYLVAALNGTTGELHALHLYASFEELLPFQVRDGTLWVHASDWRAIDRAPWAALDAVTLAPLRNNGVDIQEADDAVLEILGAGAKPSK